MNQRPQSARSTHVTLSLSRWLVAALALGTGSVTSGCVATGPMDWIKNGFKVGPNYCRPPAPVAADWIDGANPSIQHRRYEEWWKAFQDPTLDHLIASAYLQNLNLRVLGTR